MAHGASEAPMTNDQLKLPANPIAASQRSRLMRRIVMEALGRLVTASAGPAPAASCDCAGGGNSLLKECLQMAVTHEQLRIAPIDLDDLIGAVIRRGQSRLLSDVRLDPTIELDMVSSVGATRSWLGVPLVSPTGAFGALIVADPTPHAFSPRDDQALSELASLA